MSPRTPSASDPLHQALNGRMESVRQDVPTCEQRGDAGWLPFAQLQYDTVDDADIDVVPVYQLLIQDLSSNLHDHPPIS